MSSRVVRLTRSANPAVVGLVLTTLLAGCDGAPVIRTPPSPTAAGPAGTGQPTPADPVAGSASAAPAPASIRVSAPVSGAGSGVAGVAGVDVSGHQASVNWAALARRGSAFAYVKATEGTTYRDPRFAAQRRGARAAGLLTGSYHYARPTASTGAAQARYFVANGGARAADGRTLPGALDLEKAAQGDPCYGRTPEQLVAWIRDFTVTYRDLTGRQAVIYVTAEWWDRCTGAEPSFASTNPLWLYDHDGSMGPFPSGWRSPLLWQHAVRDGLDRNVFRGSAADLQLWASRPRE